MSLTQRPFSFWARVLIYGVLSVLVLVSVSRALRGAEEANGFDVIDALVPAAEILHGGPGRDGIPAIDKPDFVSADKANFLSPADRVLGLQIAGQSRAYPIRVMNWHEIVNDQVDGKAVLITFCPLCGTGMAFQIADGGTFGVSGLLYNSDMLLYDRTTESLWSQIMAQAISGRRKGERLAALPLEHTTWADWQARHPNTEVLSADTGHRRDYRRSPYAGYASSRSVYFDVGKIDPRYHPKEQVVGIVINDQARVWPFAELRKSKVPVEERLGGKMIRVNFNPKAPSAWIADEKGRPLPSTTGFWFAWMAFYPDSGVFQAQDAGAPIR